MSPQLLLMFIFLNEIKTERTYGLQNLQVLRLIDISSYIVEEKLRIVLQNIGNTTIENYTFELQEDVSFLSFTNSNNETLPYEIQSGIKSSTCEVILDKPVFVNAKYVLKVKLILFSKLLPATKMSRYNEEHSFKWKGNMLFHSKYFTLKSRCIFLTNSLFNRNLKFSSIHDSASKDRYIYYSNNIKPRSEKLVAVTFSSYEPKLLVKTLGRRIYVSHYGKIMIEDHVVMYNGGPKLKGPYFNSQEKYWMFTHLPSSAENIMFFDAIGNCSTTTVYYNNGRKALKFIPRYSLRQGGWKSTYTLKYRVPAHEYIYHNKNDFFLKIRALDHIVNDVGIEDVDVTLILPEGAIIQKTIIPIGFLRENHTYLHTSLSFSKREVINLKGRFLVEEHINDIVIKYKYSSFNLLRAPLHIMILLEFVFLVFIFIDRNSYITYVMII